MSTATGAAWTVSTTSPVLTISGPTPRLDVARIGVTGRSYGGYMTLMLAGLHPEIWTAACDMFGPFDLPTWIDALPEAWQVYFHLVLGDPGHRAGGTRGSIPTHPPRVAGLPAARDPGRQRPAGHAVRVR